MGCTCNKNEAKNIDSKDLIYKDEEIINKAEKKEEKQKERYLLNEEEKNENNEFKNGGKNSETESLSLYEDAESKLENINLYGSSKWREALEDDNNFDQNIPFDFKTISFKLQKASENPENLNPFYSLSAIYDFTKFFKDISSALSMGFSDITEKCELMRQRFKEYTDAESIQDLCNKEIELELYKLNGTNNKSLGHYKDEYSNYISGCRTFLRLLWFLEYLIDVFENIIKDDGNGEIKKILGDSYNRVLAPHHGFLVRKAVSVALSFSKAGNVSDIVKLIFGYNEFDEKAIKIIKDTNFLMKKIWNGGKEFYEKNNLLNLE